MTRPIRLLLAHDQPLLRQGLRAVLTALDDLHLVGEATNAADLLRQVATLQPDILLLDLRHHADETRLMQHLAQHHPQCRILPTRSFADDAGWLAALRRTVQEQPLDGTPIDTLVRTIRTLALPARPPVSRGSGWMSRVPLVVRTA